MRIFITGADGFIGQHMVERLKDKHELGFLKEDLRDHEKVGFQIRQFDPEIIVHLAARTEVEQSFYEQIAFSDINYTGTVNLIEVAKDLPNLKEEFNSLPHDRGTLSMAHSSDPNSANSQFFICFKAAPFLDRQYTVFGKVVEGMEFVDKIKRGDENNNGSVSDPDKIISFKSL